MAVLEWAERAAQLFETEDLRWSTPGEMANRLDPRTRQTPALDLLDEALTDLLKESEGRLIISMPPQEGKSTRAARDFPLWALAQNQNLRIVTASYSQRLADRNGRVIRNMITSYPELGLRIADDNGSVSEWQLAGADGGVYSTGIGGGLTGRPADLMIIDDPIKDRKEADSKVYRDRVWEWWTDTASTRLAPGAPVVLILTRWHHDDLAGRLMAAEDGHLWRVINIPAEADHRPERDEEDPLGRAPGEFMISARGRVERQWRATKVRVGPRAWAALYQGHPSPEEGNLFPSEWPRFTEPLWVERSDGSRWVPEGDGDVELIQSWDMAFKDTASSDYVVGQVWMRQGVNTYLIDQVRGRLGFTATVEAVLSMTARWPQALAKFVEDKANGPAVINALRSRVPGLIPVEPEGSKYSRAVAVSPFVFSNNVHLPSADLLPSVEELIEEARGFPNATHDDTIDALSQAINKLLLQPIFDSDGLLTSEDIIEDNPVAYLSAY